MYLFFICNCIIHFIYLHMVLFSYLFFVWYICLFCPFIYIPCIYLYLYLFIVLLFFMFYHYWLYNDVYTLLLPIELFFMFIINTFLHDFTPSSVFHPLAFLTPSIKESLFVCFITLWQIQRLNVEHEEIKIHKATRPQESLEGEVCH